MNIGTSNSHNIAIHTPSKSKREPKSLNFSVSTFVPETKHIALKIS